MRSSFFLFRFYLSHSHTLTHTPTHPQFLWQEKTFSQNVSLCFFHESLKWTYQHSNLFLENINIFQPVKLFSNFSWPLFLIPTHPHTHTPIKAIRKGPRNDSDSKAVDFDRRLLMIRIPTISIQSTIMILIQNQSIFNINRSFLIYYRLKDWNNIQIVF